MPVSFYPVMRLYFVQKSLLSESRLLTKSLTYTAKNFSVFSLTSAEA